MALKGGLVTLAEAKAFLEISYSDKDSKISVLIGTATERVLEFIENDGTEFQDTNGVFIPGNVPDRLKTAALMYIRVMHDDPNFQADVPGSLPPAVESALHPLCVFGC